MNVIVVVRDAAEPVYEQIARQIRAQIASRALPPETVLPSVRTLAEDLAVNLNTVARAYRLLAEEGFIRIRDRSGAVVVPPAAGGAAIDRGTWEELKGILARLRQSGVSAGELKRSISREIDALRPRRNADGGEDR